MVEEVELIKGVIIEDTCLNESEMQNKESNWGNFFNKLDTMSVDLILDSKHVYFPFL